MFINTERYWCSVCLNREIESGTTAFLAFHPDAAVHHFAETPANSKTKPGPSVTSCRRCFDLTEGSEEAIHAVPWNADACIFDGKLQFERSCLEFSAGNRYQNLAVRGELQCVADQIHQNLPDPGDIADDSRWRLFIDDVTKIKVLLRCFRRQ